MPVDCTGYLTSDILYECENAPVGGIEQDIGGTINIIGLAKEEKQE